MLPFVVTQQFCAVIYEYVSLAVLQQFLHVEVRGLGPDMVEAVHAVIATHAIHRSHPEPSLMVAEDILHLIVGKS